MKILTKLAVALATGVFAVATANAQTELTVYTAVEAEDLKRYAETFNKEHPDIKINWVRDSTGIITAKLLAEKNNPQADVVWGLAATSLLLLKSEGMLEPYAAAGVDKLDTKFVDKGNPPSWVGMDAWVAAVCFNTVEAGKLGLNVGRRLGSTTSKEGEIAADSQGCQAHQHAQTEGHPPRHRLCRKVCRFRGSR